MKQKNNIETKFTETDKLLKSLYQPVATPAYDAEMTDLILSQYQANKGKTVKLRVHLTSAAAIIILIISGVLIGLKLGNHLTDLLENEAKSEISMASLFDASQHENIENFLSWKEEEQ